jgi:hypothetical protein
MNPTQILQSIGSVLVGGAIFAVALATFSLAPRLDRYMELKAMDDCAQAYRMQYTDTKSNTVISQPIKDLYNECLQDKGLQ